MKAVSWSHVQPVLHWATWEVGPSTPDGDRNVLYSSADKIKKKDESRLKVHMLVQKNKIKTSTEKISGVCSRDEQSVTSSNKEQFKDGSSNEQSNTTHTRNIENKSCQAEKSVNKMC